MIRRAAASLVLAFGLSLASARGAWAGADPAASAPTPRITPISASTLTWSGQTLALPQGPIEARASVVELPVGSRLKTHKHPYPRFAYILSGELEITNETVGETRRFKAGEFIVEAIDQWHWGHPVGDGPVKLIAIDEAPPGAPNTVYR